MARVGVGCSAELAAYSNDVSRSDRFEDGQQTRDVDPEILQPIPTAENHDSDSKCREVLLKL